MNLITQNYTRNISEPTSDTQVRNKKFFGVTFRANKTLLIDEFNKSLKNSLEESIKKDSSLSDIFADSAKTKTFIGVLGGLLTSAAACITEILHKDDNSKEYIDTFSREVPTQNTQGQNIKEKTAKAVTPESLINQCKFLRGKRTAIEKEIIEIIEKNEQLTIEEKAILAKLLDKYCGYHRNGKQVINGKEIKNADIAEQLCIDLKANDYKNCEGILEKYLTGTILENFSATRTQNNTRSTQTLSSKDLLDQCKFQRGKKTAIEKELTEIIENNLELTIEEKETLVTLINKYCGYNRNGSQIINGKEVKNTDIAKQLCIELKTKEYKNCGEIFEKYLTGNFNITPIDSPKSSQTLTLSKFNAIAKELDPVVAKKFSEQINNKFKDCSEILSELEQSLSKEEMLETIVYIANGTITNELTTNWASKYKYSKLTLTKFAKLVNNGLDDDSLQIDFIKKSLQEGLISDIDVTKQYGDYNIAMKFPRTSTLKEKFKTIINIFEVVKDERISIYAKTPIHASKESIIDELKKDYTAQNYRTSTYPNLIKFIYGQRHEINSIYSFDKNINNPRVKELITLRTQTLSKILNNYRLFDPNIFDQHSAMRFLERFVFDGHVDYNNLEYIVRSEIERFYEELNKSLNNGINIVTYETNNKIAPQFKIKNELNEDVTITLDKGGRIHTIF